MQYEQNLWGTQSGQVFDRAKTTLEALLIVGSAALLDSCSETQKIEEPQTKAEVSQTQTNAQTKKDDKNKL